MPSRQKVQSSAHEPGVGALVCCAEYCTCLGSTCPLKRSTPCAGLGQYPGSLNSRHNDPGGFIEDAQLALEWGLVDAVFHGQVSETRFVRDEELIRSLDRRAVGMAGEVSTVDACCAGKALRGTPQAAAQMGRHAFGDVSSRCETFCADDFDLKFL